MSEINSEDSKWFEERGCTYHIQPIVELREGAAEDVGFEVNLFAPLPWHGKVTPEFLEEVALIRGKLRDLVHAIVPKESEKARFEIVPMERKVRFRHGNAVPEVNATVRIFHKDFRTLEAGDRGKLKPTEDLLESLGFRRS